MAVVNHLKDEGITPNHSLRFIRSGAAALTPADGGALSACYGNIPIHGTYSMSEQMPISQPNVGRDQLHEKNGSVGIACAASMAIVNPSTLSPQPPGVRGVIAISGPTVLRNYLKNPKADAENFFLLSCADGTSPEDPDRFFLTGDVGLLDSDGHLTIKGRSKELIKRGGEQVSPYEVTLNRTYGGIETAPRCAFTFHLLTNTRWRMRSRPRSGCAWLSCSACPRPPG